jgi:hypothetical protein
MRKHLLEGHGMKNLDSKELEDQAEESHVHRNNQVRFWCGFCCKVIQYPRKNPKYGGEKAEYLAGTEAWAWRFNHIDEHFKREKEVDNWVDDAECLKKGALLAQRRQAKAEKENRAAQSAESRKEATREDGHLYNAAQVALNRSSSTSPTSSSNSSATGSPHVSSAIVPKVTGKHSRSDESSDDVEEPMAQRPRLSRRPESACIEPSQLHNKVKPPNDYDVKDKKRQIMWNCVSRATCHEMSLLT